MADRGRFIGTSGGSLGGSKAVVGFQKEILNVASVQFGVAKRSEQLYPVETATVTDSVSIRPKGRME